MVWLSVGVRAPTHLPSLECDLQKYIKKYIAKGLRGHRIATVTGDLWVEAYEYGSTTAEWRLTPRHPHAYMVMEAQSRGLLHVHHAWVVE